MEITSIDVYPVAHELGAGEGYGSSSGIRTSRTATIVRLETDTGLVGWGEAAGPPQSLRAIITEVLLDRVIGMDPFEVAGLHDELFASSYHYAQNGLVVHGLSGVDIACWDLMGKATDRSISELLPGKPRSTVNAYASTMYFYADSRDPVPLLREVKEAGYAGVKIKIGRGVENDIERVALARETLGDEIALMVDANANYRVDQAVRSATAISQFDVGWYEEPVSPADTHGYTETRSRVNVPIAGGEAHSGPFELGGLMENRCVDIIQPDVCMCGGITQAKHTAAMASGKAIGVTPHNWMSGIGLAASLQFASILPCYPSTPGTIDELLFEWDQAENPLRTEIVESSIEPEQGTITVPSGPGLGVEPDKSALESFAIV